MTDPWLDGQPGGWPHREGPAGWGAEEAPTYWGRREPAESWSGGGAVEAWAGDGTAESWSGSAAAGSWSGSTATESWPDRSRAEPGPAVSPAGVLRWLPYVEAWLPLAGGLYLAYKVAEVTLAAIARVVGVTYLNELISHLVRRWCPDGRCSRLVPVALGISFYGGALLLLLAVAMLAVLIALRQRQDGYWRLARWGLLLLLLLTTWGGGEMALSSLIPWR